jgi:hypothetical protein
LDFVFSVIDPFFLFLNIIFHIFDILLAFFQIVLAFLFKVFSLLKLGLDLNNEGFYLRLISMNTLLRFLLSKVHEPVGSFFNLIERELQVLFGGGSLGYSILNQYLIL